MSLPYDIIYNIYFYIDDYMTLTRFWILDKYFTRNYMNLSAPYKHKFLTLRSQLFDFMTLLPYNSKQLDDDILFYKNVMCMGETKDDKEVYGKDIMFVYQFYKKLMYLEVVSVNFLFFIEFPYQSCLQLLDRVYRLEFKQNIVTCQLGL